MFYIDQSLGNFSANNIMYPFLMRNLTGSSNHSLKLEKHCSAVRLMFCSKKDELRNSQKVLFVYSSYEHQRIDWVGIHEAICPLVAELKTSGLPFLGSEEERRKRDLERIEKQVTMLQHKLIILFTASSCCCSPTCSPGEQ